MINYQSVGNDKIKIQNSKLNDTNIQFNFSTFFKEKIKWSFTTYLTSWYAAFQKQNLQAAHNI